MSDTPETETPPVTNGNGGAKEKRQLTSIMGVALCGSIAFYATMIIISFFHEATQWDFVNHAVENVDRWIMFLLGAISGLTVPKAKPGP